MLSIGDLRKHVTSTLEDPDLQRLLDAAYQAIDLYAGVTGPVTEVITSGPGDLLMLSRPASAITSVSEWFWSTSTVLASNDYALSGGQMIVRLVTGTNAYGRWRGRVTVTYTPLDDTAERDRVAIALVQLDLTHNPGLSSEQIGEWTETYANNSAMHYGLEREAILATLNAGFVAA